MHKLLIKYVEEKKAIKAEILNRDISSVICMGSNSTREVLLNRCKTEGIKTLGDLIDEKTNITAKFYPHENCIWLLIQNYIYNECNRPLYGGKKDARHLIESYAMETAYRTFLDKRIEELGLSKCMEEYFKKYKMVNICDFINFARFNLFEASLDRLGKVEVMRTRNMLNLNCPKCSPLTPKFMAYFDDKTEEGYLKEVEKFKKFEKEDYLKIDDIDSVPETFKGKWLRAVGGNIALVQKTKGIMRVAGKHPVQVKYENSEEIRELTAEDIVEHLVENTADIQYVTKEFKKDNRKAVLSKVIEKPNASAEEKAMAIEELYNENF